MRRRTRHGCFFGEYSVSRDSVTKICAHACDSVTLSKMACRLCYLQMWWSQVWLSALRLRRKPKQKWSATMDEGVSSFLSKYFPQCRDVRKEGYASWRNQHVWKWHALPGWGFRCLCTRLEGSRNQRSTSNSHNFIKLLLNYNPRQNCWNTWAIGAL